MIIPEERLIELAKEAGIPQSFIDECGGIEPLVRMSRDMKPDSIPTTEAIMAGFFRFIAASMSLKDLIKAARAEAEQKAKEN